MYIPANEILMKFDNAAAKDFFKIMYGSTENINNKILCYKELVDELNQRFNNDHIHLLSTPGRTEIGGNHTDHNYGKVLAAAVNLDTVAAVSKTNDHIVRLFSSSFSDPFIVNLNDLKPKQEEAGNTSSIIRGIAAYLCEYSYNIGGFNAIISSEIPIGSGLSSSASVELLIGSIFNSLYNQNKIDKNILAKIGQSAEINYFGKPCGLMDQLAVSIGGIIKIDFKDPSSPVIKKVDYDFNKSGYSLIIVNTGSHHVDLTDEYASIPAEMKLVSKNLDVYSPEISTELLLKNTVNLRAKVGDRAILRTTHFVNENKRVDEQVAALENGQFSNFLRLITESGNSSYKWLQNCFSSKYPQQQAIPLALMISEKFFNSIEKEAACRVHGGGFAGTIQAFVPNENVAEYTKLIDGIFGEGSAVKLNIRSEGIVEMTDIFNMK